MLGPVERPQLGSLQISKQKTENKDDQDFQKYNGIVQDELEDVQPEP